MAVTVISCFIRQIQQINVKCDVKTEAIEVDCELE